MMGVRRPKHVILMLNKREERKEDAIALVIGIVIEMVMGTGVLFLASRVWYDWLDYSLEIDDREKIF